MTMKCMVLLIHTNLENNLFVGEVNHLVFLREALNSPMKLTCLAIMYAMMNRFKSVYLNEILKKSRKDLYLNLRTTPKLVVNHALQ